MSEKLNRSEYMDWLRSPITKKVKSLLKERQEEILHKLSHSGEIELSKVSKDIGIIQGIQIILDIDFDSLED